VYPPLIRVDALTVQQQAQSPTAKGTALERPLDPRIYSSGNQFFIPVFLFENGLY